LIAPPTDVVWELVEDEPVPVHAVPGIEVHGWSQEFSYRGFGPGKVLRVTTIIECPPEFAARSNTTATATVTVHGIEAQTGGEASPWASWEEAGACISVEGEHPMKLEEVLQIAETVGPSTRAD
jgi:hypothetical protein